MRAARWAAHGAFGAVILYAGLAGAQSGDLAAPWSRSETNGTSTGTMPTVAPDPRPFWSAAGAAPIGQEPPGRFGATAHDPEASPHAANATGRTESGTLERRSGIRNDGEVARAAWVAPTSSPGTAGSPSPTTAEGSTDAARDKDSSTSRSRPLPLAPRGSAAVQPGDTGRGRAGTWVTVIGSLAVVLGLFFVFAWALRRTAPRANVALPAEVFEVLGRAPLSARQEVHLLRCGTKLLLVSVTPAGAETLTEIADPTEVDRLAGLCQQARPGSATATFREVLQQLTGYQGDRLTGADAASSRSASRGAAAGVNPTWEPRDG